MAVIARKRKSGIVYRVMNRVDGVPVWETVGADKQAAHRRNAAMKKEIAAGTYVEPGSGAMTVATWARRWFRTRTNRTADNDQGLWDNHVAGRCKWFTALRLEDVKHAHMDKLVAELGMPYVSQRTGQRRVLSGKSVALVFGVVNTMFRAARRAEHMKINPCEMPRGTFKKAPVIRRTPYTHDEVRRLTDPELTPPEGAMLNALLFYTGARLGEACGLRWREWERWTTPLGALHIKSQYDDQPLKTEATAGEHSRLVPVHPDLARLLEAWWSWGFELVYCRRPTPDDFIVPCRNADGGNHTKSSGYKLFVRTCAAAGVTPHKGGAVHSTRHTFITLARRDGARKDVLERITHNACGEIIDVYTHFDWVPLCEAVMCFMAKPPPRPAPDLRVVSAPASEPREHVRPAKAPVGAHAPKGRKPVLLDERRDRARVNAD